ncbi:hypothetical protein [Streptomyces sp. 2A115]|uniref:hypothetical protein n=1 Tax=Streptomyces sp. 2A115 TaxID=3457439 RepID=UPI003FCF11FE
MSELPPEGAPLDPAESDPTESDPTEYDGNVAHPVPIDSPTTRDGDGGTPADSLPPVLGG